MTTKFPTFRLHPAVLPCAVALALTACGGGGGNVRPTPLPSTPPPSTITPPADLGFTPNVPIDANQPGVNPPPVSAPMAPATLGGRSQHLQLINAAGALGAEQTGSGVTIGFVDSGVQRDYPALAGRVTNNFVHVSNVNNLSVDDVVRHGTVVASLAAGKPVSASYKTGGGSDIWGGGVAQSATVVSSRIIADKRPTDDGSGQGNEIKAGQGYGDFFKAINAELAGAGARIINNSWGGLYWTDPLLTSELNTAWKDFVVGRGGIVVFANGNAGTDPRYRPNPSDNASLPTLSGDAGLENGWITAAALDPDNPTQLTTYSQACGRAMNYCLTAPGTVVYPDYDTGQYSGTMYFWRGGGTSYSAPLISGAAAVVWSAFPWMSNDQVRKTLFSTAKDLGDPGVDPIFGWGLLDVSKAANGPGAFLWGDFYANVTGGSSIWRNQITGGGGLVKAGAGSLSLTEAGAWTGDTRVDGGVLDLRNGLVSSPLSIRSGGMVYGSGTFGGSVSNQGIFYSGATVPAAITGNYTQGATGNLGAWLGSPVVVQGTANIAGQVTVLGVRGGYTTTAKETLLNAKGGLTGTFSRLAAAPNVFLDASLGYDANNAFLNINRINVSRAIAGLGIGGITAMSADRVEAAMSAIDGQLANGGNGRIGSGFIDAAGRLQQSPTLQAATVSLRSLSGQLHAASSAMTLDSIDAGRRAIGERFVDLAGKPRLGGAWSKNLRSDGSLARAGFDSVNLDASGDMAGHDVRLGNDAVLGVGMSRLQQFAGLGAFGDRSRGTQQEAQVYAGWARGDWYLRGQAAFGAFYRRMERNLLLGTQMSHVGTDLHGRYQSLFAEAGRTFALGAGSVTPYIGSQFVAMQNSGFREDGADGFGLQARDWNSQRTQAYAGLLAARDLRLGLFDVRLDARGEWQRTLASSGDAFQASFNGVQQWSPLQGIGLADRSALYALGLSAWHGQSGLFRLDFSHRSSALGSDRMFTAQYRLGF